jgi:hypothetical protein
VQSGNAQIGPEEWAKRLANRTNGQRAVPTQREVRPMDKQLSRTRIAIAIAIDWRLLVVIVVLVLALLIR